MSSCEAANGLEQIMPSPPRPDPVRVAVHRRGALQYDRDRFWPGLELAGEQGLSPGSLSIHREPGLYTPA
jgi:hypothetical protein